MNQASWANLARMYSQSKLFTLPADIGRCLNTGAATFWRDGQAHPPKKQHHLGITPPLLGEAPYYPGVSLVTRGSPLTLLGDNCPKGELRARLLTDTEPLNDLDVLLRIDRLEVIEKTTAVTNHLKKAAAG